MTQDEAREIVRELVTTSYLAGWTEYIIANYLHFAVKTLAYGGFKSRVEYWRSKLDVSWNQLNCKPQYNIKELLNGHINL